MEIEHIYMLIHMKQLSFLVTEAVIFHLKQRTFFFSFQMAGTLLESNVSFLKTVDVLRVIKWQHVAGRPNDEHESLH